MYGGQLGYRSCRRDNVSVNPGCSSWHKKNKQTNRFWVCFRGNGEEICLQIGCCVGEANKGMSLGFGLEELGGTACFVEGNFVYEMSSHSSM